MKYLVPVVLLASGAWPGGCSDGWAQPRSDLQQGLTALNQNDLVHAREYLEKAAQSDPQNAIVLVALAQTYWKGGQKDLALRTAARAEDSGLRTPPMQHALALLFSEAGDLRKAAEWERRYAASPGAGPEAAENAAGLSLAAGQPDEAIQWARTALQRHDTPGAHHLLGQANRAAGRMESALPELRKAAESVPSQETFLADYGQALLEHRDFSQALSLLERAQRQFPGNPQIVLAYGVACYAQRRSVDAVNAFLAVIRSDETIEQPYVFLGRILESAGPRLPEVIAAYTAWEKREPAYYLPVFLHAKALLASSDHDDEAIDAELRYAIQLNPAFADSHLERGTLLARQGKWPEAERELSRSIELAPHEARPHYDLARVYLRMGKPELAQAERAEHQRLKEAENPIRLQ